MQWSKLKTLVESRFHPSVRDKVQLYTTAYPNCACGRGWITYNKEQIANFETIVHLHLRNSHDVNTHGHLAIDNDERVAGQSIARGEMSRQSLHEACWDLLQLSIDEALESSNPIIQALAFLDSRVGKARLTKFSTDGLHPLPAKLLEIRQQEQLQRT